MRSCNKTFMVLERKLCKSQTNVTVGASNLHLILPFISIGFPKAVAQPSAFSLDLQAHTSSKFKRHASSTNNTAGPNPAVEAFTCAILGAS